MSTECNYSLSSGAATSSSSTSTCPKQKKKRLSGLISLKSRRSSQDFQRGARDDRSQCLHGATHDDNARSTMSKAAAWVWHTRGIRELEAVPPTKRVMTRLQRYDNLNTSTTSDQALPHINHNTDEAHELNILGCRPLPRSPLPMSRFKAEAMLSSANCPGNHLSLADQGPFPAAAAAYHPEIVEQHSRPACTNRSKSFLYDDLELYSLQELLDKKIDRPDPDRRHDAYKKPLKPFSAIHRLFKRLLNSSTSVQQQIPAQITPTRFKDPGNSAVHHVIHHHHHHYYHQMHDSPEHEEPNRATVRRRHSESSTFSAEEGFDIPSTEIDDQGADYVPGIMVGGLGPKLVSTDHRFRPRRQSYCASSRSAAASS